MRKKLILGASILALAIPSLVTANSNIRIWMKGNLIKSDVAPYIYQERTMVPLRVISENLGKEVTWGGDKRSVNIKDEKGNEFSLLIGGKFMDDISANVDRKIELDAPALIKDDRTFVPLRAIAEAFGERVDWDKDKRVVVIGEGYDTSKIKEEKNEDLKDEKKVLDPLGLDYLYNKDMAGKSDEEKSNYERTMRAKESKVFQGYKNGDVEGCLAWLSVAKAGQFYEPELNKDPFLNPKKDGLGIGLTKRGQGIIGYEDTKLDEHYQRDYLGLNSGPSMAGLEHFDYYLNFDGTFSYFRTPLHIDDNPKRMIKTIKEQIANAKQVKFIKTNKKDVEKLLKTLDMHYDQDF